jgi:DNA-binding CsgD family transcriptional regulator
VSDYRVKVSVRNGRLMRAFESIGHTPSSFANAYGFKPSETCALAALKLKPVLSTGMWRKSVMKLCEITRTMPSDLFTTRQMEGLRANSAQRDVDEDTIIAMLEPPASMEQLAITNDLAAVANEIIDSRLSLRSAKALRLHVEGATFEEIGQELGVTRERVRQIVMKAQRLTRAALRKRGIKSFEDERV